MSDPKNRLEKYSTYSTTFILSAWKNTSDAENEGNAPALNDGPEGKRLPGNGILVLNDHIGENMKRFLGSSLDYEFSWAGDYVNETVSTGTFSLIDVSGTDFLGFLNNDVVSVLGTSLANLTFRLDIYFHTSASEDSEDQLIKIEPLIFNVQDIKYKFDVSSNHYFLNFTSCYNTSAKSSRISQVYSMTITHKDGNLHEESPKPEESGGNIVPRSEEDRKKTSPRERRLEKSKPMKTLKEAFEALAVELNAKTKIHKNQLQDWLAIIRDDHTPKLKKPVEQKKEINIRYDIKLDPVYEDYIIDNRNLPFEQPELDGDSSGIRSIPTVRGEYINTVINRIMSLSRRVGLDAKDGYSYKVCPVWRREEDNILCDIVIKRFEIPINSMNGKDTGPGESAIDPLTFYYKAEQNHDIEAFFGRSSIDNAFETVEDIIDEIPGRLSYGSDREEISAERAPNKDFFKTGYSGLRSKLVNSKCIGVEYPSDMATLMGTQTKVLQLQTSPMIINIIGNPDLFSDTVRKPTEVVNGSHPKAVYYRKPEVFPWYAKLQVFLETEYEEDGGPTPSMFYQQQWMHIIKVRTSIEGSEFSQTITLVKMDDII